MISLLQLYSHASLITGDCFFMESRELIFFVGWILMGWFKIFFSFFQECVHLLSMPKYLWQGALLQNS